MSNQIFAGAGSIDVFPSHLRVNPGGATIAWLKNANDGDVGAGLAVVLEGGLKDGELAGDYDAFKYSIVSSISAESAAAVLSRVWGLTLEDIPAGEYGAVMLRGSAMATCSHAGQNIGGFYNALISPGGIGTDGHLVSVADAGEGGLLQGHCDISRRRHHQWHHDLQRIFPGALQWCRGLWLWVLAVTLTGPCLGLARWGSHLLPTNDANLRKPDRGLEPLHGL